MTVRRPPPSTPATQGQAGVSLVELLVALAVFGAGLAVTATAAAVVLATFEAEPAAADVQQRGRAGLHVLLDDLASAGSGFYLDADAGPGLALPAVLPDIPSATSWVAAARPHVLTTWRARRDTPTAVLETPVAAGSTTLRLRPSPSCAAGSGCGFQAGDDVLIYAPHGRVEVGEVRVVGLPLDLELAAPVGSDWPIGAFVTAIVPHVYQRRTDPATGLFQIVRARGSGPATPVVDFVTRFDVEWVGAASPPQVHTAVDGTEEYATAGALPPPPGTTADPAWPAGENCGFARDAANVPRWRGAPVPASGAVPLGMFADGPWCPSPVAPTRWDADLVQIAQVRVVLAVAAASAQLRPPSGLGLSRGTSARPVPDLVLRSTVRPGRFGGGL